MLRVALVLALVVIPAAAEADPLLGLVPGDALQEAQSRLGSSAKLHKMNEPQALRHGLLDTGLLEALNVFKATPKDRDGGLRAAPFEQLLVQRSADGQVVAAADKRGSLTFVLSRLSIPVDPSEDRYPGGSKDRLRHLRRALASLSAYGLRPIAEDRRGNRTMWRGKRGRITVHVQYRPKLDELWVLASRWADSLGDGSC